MKTQRFKIGQKFKTRGKHPRICTIIDVYKTYNTAGELVQIEYIATHDFMGQLVKSRNVDATVAMGLIREEGN